MRYFQPVHSRINEHLGLLAVKAEEVVAVPVALTLDGVTVAV